MASPYWLNKAIENLPDLLFFQATLFAVTALIGIGLLLRRLNERENNEIKQLRQLQDKLYALEQLVEKSQNAKTITPNEAILETLSEESKSEKTGEIKTEVINKKNSAQLKEDPQFEAIERHNEDALMNELKKIMGKK